MLFPKEEPRVPLALNAEPMRSWEIETMFTCILRFRSVREEALIVLEKEYFNRLGEGYLSYLLELIRRLHPEHGDGQQIPYLEVVDATLDETIPRRAGQAKVLARDEVEKLVAMPSAHHPDRPDQSSWGLLYRSYKQTSDRDVSRERGFKLIAEFVKERGYYEPLRAAFSHKEAGTVTNIRSILDVHRVTLDRVEAISNDPCFNLTPHDGYYQSVQLFSTGIPWLDLNQA